MEPRHADGERWPVDGPRFGRAPRLGAVPRQDTVELRREPLQIAAHGGDQRQDVRLGGVLTEGQIQRVRERA